MEIYLDTNYINDQLKHLSERRSSIFLRNTINTLLFDLRKYSLSPRGMQAEMQIRSKGLLKSHLIVIKAKANRFSCVGYFGSVKSPRFSGWKEQQTGEATRRKIVVHKKHARGNSGKRILSKKYRRNAGAERLLTDQKNTSTDRQKITATMAILRRQGYNGAVILEKGYYKRQPGIYQFVSKPFKTSKESRKKKRGKRIEKGLHVSDRIYDNGIRLKLMTLLKTKQPEPNPWGTDIIHRFLSQDRMNKIAMAEMEKLINRDRVRR